MKLNLSALQQMPVYVLAAVLLLVMFFDFSQRLWHPLDVRDSSLTELETLSASNRQALPRPEALAAWLAQNKQAQAGGAEGEAGPVQALPGSVALEQQNVRIRAIFVSGNALTESNGEQQAIAIAELQDSATGAVTRAQWRVQEHIGGWQVQAIEPKRVLLVKQQDSVEQLQQIELYVFEPSQQEPVMLEVERGTN